MATGGEGDDLDDVVSRMDVLVADLEFPEAEPFNVGEEAGAEVLALGGGSGVTKGFEGWFNTGVLIERVIGIGGGGSKGRCGSFLPACL